MRFWVWRDLDRIFEEAWPFSAACKTTRTFRKRAPRRFRWACVLLCCVQLTIAAFAWGPAFPRNIEPRVPLLFIFAGGRNGGCILGQIQRQARLRLYVCRAAARDCQHGREERSGREPSVLEAERPCS